MNLLNDFLKNINTAKPKAYWDNQNSLLKIPTFEEFTLHIYVTYCETVQA